MYRLKKSVSPDWVEKYGFRKGKEYPDYEKVICNESEYEDYWLVSMSRYEPEKVLFADEEYGLPVWSICIQSEHGNRLWIECVPPGSYYIASFDMQEMFYVLMQMIQDGIIEDDYSSQKGSE